MSLRKRFRSVRIRLTIAYVVAMLVVLAVYAGVVYVSVQRTLSQALDKALRDDFAWPKSMMTEQMVRQLISGKARFEDTESEESQWMQLWSENGQKLLGATFEARRNPIDVAADLAKNPDGNIRTLNEMVPPRRILTGTTQVGNVMLVVQVSESEAPMRQNLRDLLLILLLGLPVAVAIAGLGGYTLARRALLPVDRMAEQARLITAERLKERLPVDNPKDELGRLATVFNQTLKRLESSFEQMRRTNCGHRSRRCAAWAKSDCAAGAKPLTTEKSSAAC